MTTDNVTKLKTESNNDIRTKIIAVANAATSEELAAVEAIITKAKSAEYSCALYTLTPAMSALIFLNHNARNRAWRVEGLKGCVEYARRMTAGIWKDNCAVLGFYTTGALADGQHRTSGAALAGHTLNVPVVFGIKLEAIDTVDEGIPRHASDHAGLEGIGDSARKQKVIKIAGSYFAKSKIESDSLLSEAETKEAIKRNDDVLVESLEIGDRSTSNIVDPLLPTVQAAIIAYILLKTGWPSSRVREHLASLQARMSKDGEKSPHFVAAQLVSDSRESRQQKDKLSTVKEIGIVIKAFIESESGANALQPRVLRDSIKKNLPNPSYPSQQQAA